MNSSLPVARTPERGNDPARSVEHNEPSRAVGLPSQHQPGDAAQAARQMPAQKRAQTGARHIHVDKRRTKLTLGVDDLVVFGHRRSASRADPTVRIDLLVVCRSRVDDGSAAELVKQFAHAKAQSPPGKHFATELDRSVFTIGGPFCLDDAAALVHLDGGGVAVALDVKQERLTIHGCIRASRDAVVHAVPLVMHVGAVCKETHAWA